MNFILKDLNPKRVLYYFEELSSIPRGSYYEDQATKYIVDFAKKHDLWVYCDAYKNVYIKKDATKDKQHSNPILFQGHLDMVCEKESTSTHNFLKDGLKLQVDGDILSAKGTTLGADNGIAIALMLALLEIDTISHPPIECLMTVQEEVGLIGAQHIEPDKITARTMINLDTSEYGCVLTSCSGGRETKISKTLSPIYEEKTALEIKITGLQGGHSGININEGRGNANKIMAELLMDLILSQEINISTLCGGQKSNAIPRETTCKICVENIPKTLELIKRFKLQMCKNYGKTENISIITNEVLVEEILSYEQTIEIVKILVETPNGVVAMDENFPNLVKTSLNLGVVSVSSKAMSITFSLRSSNEDKMNQLAYLLTQTANKYSAAINHTGIYPGWEYQKDSPIRTIFGSAYKKLTGEQIKVGAVHCGLECGIIKSKIPDMDIIACGPNIYDYHCPSERLELSSLLKFWDLIKAVLASL